jgi:phage repressor protein C with HTH and peptisase S24 domain
MAAMTTARDLIRAKLDTLGLSMKEASEAIGKNHAYLQQYLERGVPGQLPEEPRERLATLLGVQPRALKDSAPLSEGREAGIRGPVRRLPAANLLDRIPVLGIAEGGEDGWSLWNGETVDTVPTPPSLSGAPNGYATYVVGTSMEPRYYPGEVIYVHPGRPVTIGTYVVVQVKPKSDGEPPRALIKRLIKRTALKITLAQFNPEKSFDIPLKDVVSMHRIVGSGE